MLNFDDLALIIDLTGPTLAFHQRHSALLPSSDFLISSMLGK